MDNIYTFQNSDGYRCQNCSESNQRLESYNDIVICPTCKAEYTVEDEQNSTDLTDSFRQKFGKHPESNDVIIYQGNIRNPNEVCAVKRVK